MRSLLAADAVHRPARRLPRVVRGARAEVDLVRDDVRVAADLLRALRVTEKVRVVLLLPDEHEMRGRHERRNEETAGRRTGERIGADADPPDVLLAVLGPELFALLGNRLAHSGSAGVDLLPPHLRKGSDTVAVVASREAEAPRCRPRTRCRP